MTPPPIETGARKWLALMWKLSALIVALVAFLTVGVVYWLSNEQQHNAVTCIQDSAQARTGPTIDFANSLITQTRAELHAIRDGRRITLHKQVAYGRQLLASEIDWKNRLVATAPGHC